MAAQEMLLVGVIKVANDNTAASCVDEIFSVG
jgi:hypothetical protein